MPMIKTAIILAGGFGTRLKSVVADVPKPMAPVADLPFLVYLLNYAKSNGIEKAVLAVGYKHEVISNYFGTEYKGIKLHYALEDQPLGTGGAIWNTFSFCKTEEEVVVLNGDSLFEVDIQAFGRFKVNKNATMALALKPMMNFDRYGVVEIDEEQRILNFQEKTFREAGLINGGVYCFNIGWAKGLGLPQKFSFEKEILEKYVSTQYFYGFESQSYFIDIGIPVDYERAQTDFLAKK